jgi:hypothetical protein
MRQSTITDPIITTLYMTVVGSILTLHRKKKVRKFLVPSRDVTTKLSLGGNNDVITELFLPRGSLVSDIPAGDGKLVNLFLRCMSFFNYYLSQGSHKKESKIKPTKLIIKEVTVYLHRHSPQQSLENSLLVVRRNSKFVVNLF